MADVFISYSREDRARAEQIARGLQAQNLDVFWDSEIPPGQTWADYIEEKLSGCKAVIVLWSQHSAKSQWVREEARMGRDRGKLIPVMIDGTLAPFGFGEVQAADLTHWTGAVDDPNWQRVVQAVNTAAQRPNTPPPRPAMAAPRPAAARHSESMAAEKKGPPWLWIGIGAAAVIAVLVIVASLQPNPAPVVAQNPLYQEPAAPAPAAPSPAQISPAQTGLTQEQYQQQALERLAAVQQQLANEGFQLIGQPSSGSLNAGASQAIPAQLFVGYEYRFAAVCDQDCGDLDLALYDGMNNLISQDNSTDNYPIVPVLVTGSGNFTLQVQMYACAVQPCFYAVGLYGRATQ